MHPRIDLHAVGQQILLNLFQLEFLAGLHKIGHALFFRGAEPLVAVLLRDRIRDLTDVLGVIAVLRQRVIVPAEVFKIACLQRFAEHDDLVAGVVDIVFAQHVIAACLHQSADAVAPGGVAGMAAVQLARGVGADPLHQDALAPAAVVETVAVARGNDLVDQAAQGVLLQAEVDEARAGNGNALHLVFQ